MKFTENQESEIDPFFDELKSYITQRSPVIATQKLCFSLKGEATKNELVIRMYAPIQINASIQVAIELSGTFACYVDFSHLCNGYLFYGYDEFQVISFASNIDPLLRALDKECNLYFDDKTEYEFYFYDACNHY